jgi:hypothetical protein
MPTFWKVGIFVALLKMIEQAMSICYIVFEGRGRNSAPRRENLTGSYTHDFSFSTPISQTDP